ncbi:Ldh family oxidoreductase [Salipiger sp. 1_MG-2023]|uniref:Ldh family oxidoreductase n=1 Tax=Salipiger sp. 1_MG-2023 TaxID=3062665 RepID=UPI0026E2180F|nr:Ldh family oxidoreductase [Salipiger sp. 1_MG-2023]MDO6587482.1 Ldh family oxidoreductase [Salipiger sp. 1_MG-2023]
MSVTTDRIPADRLVAFVARVLGAVGVPPEEAAEVARTMVEADLLGYDTHGVFRLKQYVDRLRAGGTLAASRPVILQETAATALVDGQNGMGHLAMNFAVALAMSKARDTGVGWVGLRGSNHAGPAALYVRPQAKAGMIGMVGAVGSANHMPAWNGMDLLLGTNPLAISAPGGSGAPFVLDMATTVAAMGKIKTLAQRGEPMPEGWMIDRNGDAMTDPAQRDNGFLLPVGGPKGYGLALAIGLLAGAVNGAALGSNVVNFTADKETPTNTGQFVMALDVRAFGSVETFGHSVDRVFDELIGSTALPGTDGPRIPGANREAIRLRNITEGIALAAALRGKLEDLAHEVDVTGL